jgi:hypothetical protein
VAQKNNTHKAFFEPQVQPCTSNSFIEPSTMPNIRLDSNPSFIHHRMFTSAFGKKPFNANKHTVNNVSEEKSKFVIRDSVLYRPEVVFFNKITGLENEFASTRI